MFQVLGLLHACFEGQLCTSHPTTVDCKVYHILGVFHGCSCLPPKDIYYPKKLQTNHHKKSLPSQEPYCHSKTSTPKGRCSQITTNKRPLQPCYPQRRLLLKHVAAILPPQDVAAIKSLCIFLSRPGRHLSESKSNNQNKIP